MEENKMLEKIWSEAQTIEVPEDLSPERMKERIEAQAKEDTMKKKSERRQESRNRFRWHGYQSRVAAAAVVLALSLGAYGVAGRQSYEPPLEQDADGAGDQASPNGAGAPGQMPADAAEDGKQPDEDGMMAAAEEPAVKQLGNYHLAESYEEVYRMVADAQRVIFGQKDSEGEMATGASDDVGEFESADVAPAEDGLYNSASRGESEAVKKAESASEKTDFSTTNLQVTGVDESDIVKTDGKNIYIAANDQVRIVDVTTGEPRQLGSIKPQLSGNMDSICEMYVSDERLVLIVQIEEPVEMEVQDSAASKKYSEDMACGYGYDYSNVHTRVLTYDITVPAGAKLLGTYEQDGWYDSSRKIGDMLYLFTNYGFSYNLLYGEARAADGDSLYGEAQPLNEKSQEDAAEKIRLPKVQGETIPADCIYLPKDGVNAGVVISAMNLTRPEEVSDQKFICNGGGELYVTAKSIYLYESGYHMAFDRQRTSFSKFKIVDGKITADCAEAVPGFVEDTFAVHETADGYLYVLTTDYNNSGTTNQLYVLDEKMKICGKIEHIADGEMVYAARFVDDIGYFVTYRNTDPLFTVDFSDPKKPKLIGELEIPGFSDYLQFWDDKHLIGVGEERKEKDSEFVGIKVSLYDISDPTDVKETSKVVIDDAYGSPATYNYKALLADRGKNIIAFLTEGQDENYDIRITQQVFTVKDGKLVQAAKDQPLHKGDASVLGYLGAETFRNLYIGDKLYLAAEHILVVYDMADGFERVNMLKLE